MKIVEYRRNRIPKPNFRQIYSTVQCEKKHKKLKTFFTFNQVLINVEEKLKILLKHTDLSKNFHQAELLVGLDILDNILNDRPEAAVALHFLLDGFYRVNHC